MKKIIFFDIDGTLVDYFGGITEIRPRVKEAIREMQANGNYVFIATGRPYAFLSDSIRSFGFDGFVLANGAHVIIDNKTIYERPMDKEFVKALVGRLKSRNIQHILESEVYSYLDESYKEFSEFYDKVGVSKKYFKGQCDIDKINIYKIEILSDDKEGIKYSKECIKQYSEYDFFNSIADNYLEVYRRSSTKAQGILKALEFLNIPIENSYAFGDGENDIEMLSTVGMGIAMGNAREKVKESADKITETVHNDGVAVGIERYILDFEKYFE